LGYSGSGKTTSIYQLTKALSSSGLRVGVIKHVHDEHLSLDKRGKDTWVYVSAGASIVAAASQNDLAIFRKRSLADVSINSLLRIFRQDRVDFVMVEGFYQSMSKRRGITRIMCAESKNQASSLLRYHRRPVCILSKQPKKWKDESFRGIPVLSLPGDTQVLLKLIEA
jgi:molybdopterin-guanine dinucleotide biosynthesis protein MobB